jgi:hypothetical protein
LAVASGTGAQTMTTALTLNGVQQVLAGIAGTNTVPAYSFAAATTYGLRTATAQTGLVLVANGTDIASASSVNGFYVVNVGIGLGASVAGGADVKLTRAAAATLQFGAANAAAPIAQTLRAQGSRAGTDVDIAGANLTIQSGQGTGASVGSSLIFQTPLAVASGSGAQTLTTALTLDGSQNATFGGTVLAGDGTAAATAFGQAAHAGSGLFFSSSGVTQLSVLGTVRLGLTTAALSVPSTYIIGFAALADVTVTPDAMFTRGAAATIQLGAANAAAPVAQTLRAQGSRSGTDTNVAGANLTIQSGNGTGNSTGSKLLFQTPVAVASGTGAQTLTTQLDLSTALASFTPNVGAPIFDAATGFRVAGAAATGNVLRGNGTNFRCSTVSIQ